MIYLVNLQPKHSCIHIQYVIGQW